VRIGQDGGVQQTARPSRAARSPRDLALSLIALLVPVFLVVGLFRLLGHEQPPVVDTAQTYQAAVAAGAFPVASPARLPKGWRPLSASFSTDAPAPTLRIGLRAPSGAVQLVESSLAAGALVTAELGEGARALGEVRVADRSWQGYVGAHGVRALVLAESGRTIILIGTAGERDLRDLAESLG
jgi:hypothetical protein